MSRAPMFWLRLVIVAGLSSAIVVDSSAQLPYGKLDWVFPPGGQAGGQIDTTIGGADVDIAESLVFEHPGITAVQKQTPATEFESARPIPNQFTVHVAEHVPPGIYDVRAVGRFGASTPRAYQVGDAAERSEPGDNQTLDKAHEIQLGETINGRANVNAADYYRIHLAADQRVLIQLAASAIDSQMDGTLVLLDASGRELMVSRDHRARDPVIDFCAPEDGDYLIKVFDFTYLGGNNHFYRLSVTNKPVVEFAFPPAIEPGRTTTLTLFGWNLPGSTVHETWKVNGRPLESVDVSVTAPTLDPLGRFANPLDVAKPHSVEVAGFHHRFQSGLNHSNPFFVALAQAPVVLEQADDNTAESPQQITVPCEVAGRFYPARDDDWYEFTAKKGDVFWVEVFAQRHGVPADPYLLIQRVQKNEDGSEQRSDVAEIDDGPGRPGGKGFGAATSDPVYRLSVGEDAIYRVLVRDLLGQSRSRPQNIYRLVIRREQPDYHLLVTPQSPFNPDAAQPLRWTTVLRRGGSIALPISVVRVDGFNEPIKVSVAGLPENVTAPVTSIGPGRNSGVISITAGETAGNWSGAIEIIGNAQHNGRSVIRTAKFATLAWDTPGKNARMTPRITGGAVLRVSDDNAPLQVVLKADQHVTTSRGGKIAIPFTLTRRAEIKDKIGLGAHELPGGVKAEVKLADKADDGQLLLTVEPSAKPGDYSFCLAGKTKISYRRLPDRVDTAEGERKALEERAKEIASTQQSSAEALAAAENELKMQTEAVAAAEQQFAQLLQQENVPVDQQATLQQKVDQSKQQLVEKQQAKDVAATAATAAQQRHNAAQEALKRLTERVKQLTENAKPGDRNIYVASNALTLRINQDPINLTFPPEVTIIQGGEQNVKLVVERRYGFTDAVRVEPSVADGNGKLNLSPLEIPAGQTSGGLVIKAAQDSPVGTYSLNLKAKLKFNNFDLELQRAAQVNVAAPPPPPEAAKTEK